jgi:hypothetical protein
MREEQSHPMWTFLQKAERSLSGMVRNLRAKLSDDFSRIEILADRLYEAGDICRLAKGD